MIRHIAKRLTDDRFVEVIGTLGGIVGIDIKSPVFIIGTGRCGTSLLLRILRSHDEITVFPNEANHLWHPLLYPLEKLENNRFGVSPFEIDPAHFTRISLEKWPANHGNRIVRLFRGYHMANGMRHVFVVKSAMVSFMLQTLLELFPSAKFIHVYRFGPSVVESYVTKNYQRYNRFSYPEENYRTSCAKYWNSCILEIDRFKNSLADTEPTSFLEIEYEKLCAAPRNSLQCIATFLGVRSAGFMFDLSKIISTNWKAERSLVRDDRSRLLKLMRPAMELKGYADTTERPNKPNAADG